MNKQDSDIQSLFLKYSNGTASLEEVKELLALAAGGSHDEELTTYMQQQMSSEGPQADFDTERWAAVLDKIKKGYFSVDQQKLDDQQQNVPQRKISLWPRIAVVAAAVAAITLGVWLYYTSSHFSSPSSRTEGRALYTNDIAPGKNTATLTLANGKTIKLSSVTNGELANEAGVVITKSADGQLVYEVKESGSNTDKMNTLSTANGETYQVRLPDGSKVYLNAASSLTYSASLMQGEKRVVSLQGEGFFEIAKDKKHPFVVKTAQQQIQVMGTHFNVMAYSNEAAVATTLVEGSVMVSSADKQKIIKPGEQALTTGIDIEVSEANLENITDWKNGDFYFEGIDFKSVMRKIARWYDVEVIYEASLPDDISSYGMVSRNNKLSDVLRSIEKSGQVHFRIEGKKIYVIK